MRSPFADAPFGTPASPFRRPASEDGSLDWRVTDAQRDRVVDYLGQAYADGRLTISEFEKRMEDAFAARTRRELNQTLSGLATVPMTASLARPLALRRSTGPTPMSSVGTGLVGLAPLTFTGPLVPLVAVALTEKGSWTRSQVANQANAQIYMWAVMVLLGILHVANPLMVAAGVGYLALTVIQAVKGFQGETWRSPITRAVPFQLIKEQDRPRKSLGR